MKYQEKDKHFRLFSPLFRFEKDFEKGNSDGSTLTKKHRSLELDSAFRKSSRTRRRLELILLEVVLQLIFVVFFTLVVIVKYFRPFNEGRKMPMLIVNRISTKQEERDRIEKYFKLATESFKNDQQIIDDLQALRDYGVEMVEWVDEYDVIDGIQANGFRSILSFGIGLVAYAVKNHHRRNFNVDDLRKVLNNFRHGIRFVRKLRDESKETKSLEMSSDVLLEFLKSYLDSFDAIKNFYCRIGQFDLGPTGYKGAKRLFKLRLSFVTPSFLASIRAKYDREYRKQLIAMSIKTGELVPRKHDSNPVSKFIINKSVSWYVNRKSTKPDIIKDIFIPKQARFVVQIDDQNNSTYVEDTKITTADQPSGNASISPMKPSDNSVTCQLIRKRDIEPNTVMIFMHGGAFIVGDRTTNEGSCRLLVDKVPKLAIVSVEYGLAPEHPFPRGLQDCLDVYFFFASPNNAEAIKSTIGFVPTKLIIGGDSAGGNLTITLTLALGLLRQKNIESLDFIFPTAIYPFYPCTSLYPTMKPSFVINVSTALLVPTISASIIPSYLPKSGNTSGNNEKTDQPTETNSNNTIFHKPSTLQWLFSTKMLPDIVVDEKLFERKLSPNEYPLTKDPLVSPIFASDRLLEIVKDVSMYIYVCRLDGLQDEGLIFAKKWIGPKNVFVMNNLLHGFLSAPFMPNTREAIELIAKHVKEQIDADKTDEPKTPC